MPAPTTPAPTTPAPTTPAPTGNALGAGQIQYGPTYTGEGTFYGATGEGNCLYDATSDRMIAAMNHTDYENSQACGAYVAVTGPTGTTITVKIVDQCPECKPGDIDLSAEAFAKLGGPVRGPDQDLLEAAQPGDQRAGGLPVQGRVEPVVVRESRSATIATRCAPWR